MKLKAKEDAYKSGDRALYKKAKYEVQKGICGAKIEYKWKLENQFLANNTRAVRKGMQTTTGYKKCSTTSCNDPQLPDNLNEFYSHFDHQNTTPVTASPPDPATPLPPPSIVEESAVKKLFRKQNSRKATGPDKVSTSMLKHCADQLSPVFTDIFNTSLQLSKVPHCFKTSVIIPVPKKLKVTSMNDYRLVALTFEVTEVFECLVLKHLKSVTSHRLDPLQFTYRENHSVDDAVAFALHFILHHLESPNRYTRNYLTNSNFLPSILLCATGSWTAF